MDNAEKEKLGKIIIKMVKDNKGAMNADDFRDYMLAFLFLRYLSDQRDDLVWHSISTMADKNDTGLTNRIKWVFKHIENDAFKVPFTGLFSEVNLDSIKLGKTEADRNAQLAKMIVRLNKDLGQFTAGRDIIGDIYENMIASFAAGSGKGSGEFYTPKCISDIMSAIVCLNSYDPSLGHKDSLGAALDPTCGSGSLLINLAHHIGLENINMIYGQEINHTTYNLARMNMILHGIDVEQFEIFNGDTLLNEWHMLRENRCLFDAIVANPPFAQDIDHDKLANDPRFAAYGLPPKGDADLAFLLHGLHYLTDDGTMAIVMSNGVLYRGKSEGKIREKLIKDGNIDAIISLPGGLFFNTSIPVCLIIVKKHRNAKDILFINASNNFHKGQKHNALLPEHISKIIDTYQYRNDCDRYSKKVSIDDIEKDGYNLNVSRYVSTQEPEKEIDLNALHAQLVDLDIESAKLKARVNVFMDELGLNPFSSEAKLDELIEAQERNLEILRSYKK